MADCIHALVTANIKTALQNISGIQEVSEMRSFLDRDSKEFIMLQECPIEYSDDFQHTGDVKFQYNIVYFGGSTDEKPASPFTYQNRNIVADIVSAIMTDRTRGGYVQNTNVVASGPGIYNDGDGNVIPITYVSIDCQALIDADNPYNLST
jgi:hypothetical protein